MIEYTNAVYSGEEQNGEPNGYGELKYHNGDRFVGHFSDGKLNGSGTKYYNNGMIIEGDFSMGVITRGKAKYTTGNIFTGIFKDSYPYEGIMEYTNGDKFEGFFDLKRDYKKGTYYFKDGSKYVGELIDGLKHGKGIEYIEGYVYDGTYDNDNKEGLFDVTKGGMHVSATYHNNLLNGYCKIEENGNVYEGNYVDELEDGKWKITKNGKTFYVTFSHGKIIDSPKDVKIDFKKFANTNSVNVTKTISPVYVVYFNEHKQNEIDKDIVKELEENIKKNQVLKNELLKIEIEIDKDIRASYKGGFTYLNPLYKEKETGSGIVFDVNSMYPARMSYDLLPYSEPLFFKGKYEPDPNYPLYVQQLTCNFKLKKGKIPSIQIKHNSFFIPNEYVESSDDCEVTLVLTSVDLELFFENYDVTDITWHSGWKFKAMTGLFTDYINKWTEKKIEAKKAGNSALYRIAKLMLNSTYGKFGLNGNSRQKYPYLAEDGSVKYLMGEIEQRKTIYIPIASFITSYARAYIIKSSEIIREYSLKKYGYDAYVYSDTDSIHCLLSPDDEPELSEYLEIDDYKLGAWKLESTFSKGKYLRQKCYIELNDDELNVTVAGMPKRLAKYINFDNFNIGFTTAGMKIDNPKLTYKHVNGGVLLVETDFTIK